MEEAGVGEEEENQGSDASTEIGGAQARAAEPTRPIRAQSTFDLCRIRSSSLGL